MQSLFNKLKIIANHLSLLDKTFKDKKNYSNTADYLIYKENERELKKIANLEKLKSANIKTNESGDAVNVLFSFVRYIVRMTGK